MSLLLRSFKINWSGLPIKRIFSPDFFLLVRINIFLLHFTTSIFKAYIKLISAIMSKHKLKYSILKSCLFTWSRSVKACILQKTVAVTFQYELFKFGLFGVLFFGFLFVGFFFFQILESLLKLHVCMKGLVIENVYEKSQEKTSTLTVLKCLVFACICELTCVYFQEQWAVNKALSRSKYTET